MNNFKNGSLPTQLINCLFMVKNNIFNNILSSTKDRKTSLAPMVVAFRLIIRIPTMQETLISAASLLITTINKTL